MRIHGAPEHDNEDTTVIVIDVINSKMSFKPPLESSQLERSHRVGPKLDQQDRVRSRLIIVRFKSENTRDAVLKARFRLKEHNEQHRDAIIYINEDLTAPCHPSPGVQWTEKDRETNDCWTAIGNVMVKDNQNKIRQIRSGADIQDQEIK